MTHDIGFCEAPESCTGAYEGYLVWGPAQASLILFQIRPRQLALKGRATQIVSNLAWFVV